jgi:hypothetical protein
MEISKSKAAEKRLKLIALIRRIARDEAYNILHEHLQDYEHKQRKPEPTEILAEEVEA